MRAIGVVTTSRADYGIYRQVLRAIEAHAELRLRLLVSGSHLSAEFGTTANEIERDGFEISERVLMLLSSDTPEGIAKSMGLAVLGFAQAYARSRPDFLVVLGDRFEMHAAALAALPFTIPVAHIHGGEVTEGAIDDSLRHSITKLSHLHFTSTEEYARRVIQLGEEPWRVTVTGAPSLDNLRGFVPSPVEELESSVEMVLPERGFLLVTFHPATIEHEKAGEQVRELLDALGKLGMPTIFTMPNADTGGREIRRLLREHLGQAPVARCVENFGTQQYFTLMSRAAAIVGNSSSGILEGASFATPVVNVGERQSGRTRARNVLDVPCRSDDILEAVRRAVSPEFIEALRGLVNPYGDGNASSRIVSRLSSEEIGTTLLRKRFHSLPGWENV